MKKIIVTTTISPVTEATRRYAAMPDWELIVVGDKQTPVTSYMDIDCDFLTVEYQKKKWNWLSRLIGWDCAERKNIGILEAYERGADIFAIVDDDNIPLANWGKSIVIGKPIEVNYFETDNICFDPYYHTAYPWLWHRGFPLELLSKRQNFVLKKKTITPDIQTGLVNGNPDIDAICRMEHSPICVWDNSYLPMSTNAFSPFNSQNTIFTREVAEEYFMMVGTGRMTDIWAGYYVLAKGFKLVYTESDVFHDRHPHNLMIDFKDELPGYTNNINLLNRLSVSPESIAEFLRVRPYAALEEYKRIIKSIKDAKI